RRRSGRAEDHVTRAIDGETRTFVVRVTTERGRREEAGYVLTFDDITDLLAAQRNAAWADVARRIAHEIKNPLTPIQLSAERIRRRYAKEITTRPEIFAQCTDTIIRQVEDIGRMVDEFSSFARMPSARPEPNDLVQVMREALLLQRVSSDDITFDLDLPEAPLTFAFDRRLVTQAITNLVKNARESIEARLEENPQPPGRIRVEVTAAEGEAVIRVIDNGRGLPRENRSRLTEPYMTTREKGTGLGLAIVQRIMEEHGGRLLLDDAPDGIGAAVSLVLPMGEEGRTPQGDGADGGRHPGAARENTPPAGEDTASAPDAAGEGGSTINIGNGGTS
ncbi:MAG TPA: PAS domain-containing sensor histidine kinase, partial [Bryobacterales bacterium]|nr:PAS domain-containing sensor histidine kinase [Bryobacterales bacterium]